MSTRQRDDLKPADAGTKECHPKRNGSVTSVRNDDRIFSYSAIVVVVVVDVAVVED